MSFPINFFQIAVAEWWMEDEVDTCAPSFRIQVSDFMLVGLRVSGGGSQLVYGCH